MPLRLKVEINTREHFTVAGFVRREFSMSSRWHTAQCALTTYTLEELLGTKCARSSSAASDAICLIFGWD